MGSPKSFAPLRASALHQQRAALALKATLWLVIVGCIAGNDFPYLGLGMVAAGAVCMVVSCVQYVFAASASQMEAAERKNALNKQTSAP